MYARLYPRPISRSDPGGRFQNTRFDRKRITLGRLLLRWKNIRRDGIYIRRFRQNCRRAYVYVYIYTSFQNSIPIAIRETDDAVPSRFLVASLNLMPSPLRLPFYLDPRVSSPLWEIRSTDNVRYIGHRK